MCSKKAVILTSGGLDSTTVLAYAQNQGFSCYAISFDYGQRHRIELSAAQKIAQTLKAKNHKIIRLDPDMFAPSALTHEAASVPIDQKNTTEIPSTYVPARNTIFLSIALGYAENIGAQDIFFGASHVDYSGYPDCRPEFVSTFQHLANVATKAGVTGYPYHIHTPLMELSKAETILLGQKLGVDYSQTISCYQADSITGAACGKCDSCYLRREGFLEANVPDPTFYR